MLRRLRHWRRSVWGIGCKGTMDVYESDSGEVELHVCDRCGDFEIRCRNVGIRGDGPDLEAATVAMIEWLEESGLAAPAGELRRVLAGVRQVAAEM